MGPRSPNKPQCHLKLRMEFWERVTRMKLQTRKQHEAFATLNSVAEPVCRLRCLCWCRSWDAESFAGPAHLFRRSLEDLKDLCFSNGILWQGCNFDHDANCLEKLESYRDCLES